MATKNTNTNVRFTTAVGVASYPWLNKPDTKWKAEGEYKCNLIVTKQEAAPLLAAVKKAADEMLAKQKAELKPKDAKVLKLADNLPVRAQVDDEGNATGKWVIGAKQKASVTTKDGKTFEKKVALFDAAGHKCDANVGGGSKLRLNVELYPYYSAKDKEVGVSLRLVAAQIIELVEFGSGGSADSYGFGAVEGGYEGESFPSSNASQVSGKADEEADDETAGDDADLY